MKFKILFKVVLVILLIFTNSIYSFAQTSDSIFMENNSKVIILGIKKFNNLVLVSLKNKPFITKDGEEFFIVTEKENIKSFTYSKNDFRYSVFDTTCYIITWDLFPLFVREYIIPNASSNYLPILNKTYPNRFIMADNIVQMVDKKIEYYEHYKYQKINYKKFMIALVNVSLYNQYRDRIRPQSYRFRGDKAEQGMYIKVLIPLIDE